MSTEIKLCVDCAACTDRYAIGKGDIFRITSDEFHWCTSTVRSQLQ